MKSTKQWEKYWRERKIDWKAHYLNTWNHPHRELIIRCLKTFPWMSLWEVGCASGPNLYKIIQEFPGKQLGGSDINADAVAEAKKTFHNTLITQEAADELILSDKCCDVILTDMTLILIGKDKIMKVLKDFRRIARNRIILVEYDSDSWWKRLKLKIKTGYNAYDYSKLLKNAGFWDIMEYRIPENYYPDDRKMKENYYMIITAKP